jgi:Txe/YoeB family toxin of Txe-Axe toxin-antitoxin module
VNNIKNVRFANKTAIKQYEFLKEKDKKTYKKFIKLVENIKLTPYTGIGKPEMLSGI